MNNKYEIGVGKIVLVGENEWLGDRVKNVGVVIRKYDNKYWDVKFTKGSKVNNLITIRILEYDLKVIGEMYSEEFENLIINS